MHYSFTEKKRIRKSFSKRANVHSVPYLLATQLESYYDFLQSDKVPSQRKNEGLQSAFTSIFPIVSHNGFARLEFLSYTLGVPPFDVKERRADSAQCQPAYRPPCTACPQPGRYAKRHPCFRDVRPSCRPIAGGA